MKLRISVFNKTQVVTAFLPQAIQIAELFGCEVEIRCIAPLSLLPIGLDFLPVHTGRISEFEIFVQGDGAWEALSAIRRCMSQCFSEVNYQMN
jgi:hypothetical protein